MKKINVGLIGFGTIGAGVARVLLENRQVISDRLGAELKLAGIADLDITSDRGVKLPEDMLLTNDVNALLGNPEIDIIIELIGGYEPARSFVSRALQSRQSVVTANKALLAKHGNELFALARENRVDLYYEASVGGGIPIIKVLREALAGNQINSVCGILNGTCNYILSRMGDEGADFTEVLKKAQELGYAEADPTFDVEGIDTAHKLAILTSLAFATPIAFDKIHVEGISGIKPADFAFAREFGYKIKLLAIAKKRGDCIETRVHPTMIPENHMLAKIDGVFNAVFVNADALGPSLYYGQGAGMMATASAVVADLVDIARNLIDKSMQRIPDLGFQRAAVIDRPYRPMSEIISQYYLRFSAHDKTSVLSRIAGILGENGISIASVIQQGRSHNGDTVAIVMQTHKAKEQDLRNALTEIDQLPVIAAATAVIRMESDL
ncbi:MAG: homoserine dehydrogenase [Deltaproteobacteria bacterium]|nr:homoserine dehydrogenase [Deltaproteobacteria bacterium]